MLCPNCNGKSLMLNKMLIYHSGLWSQDIDTKNPHEEMINIQFREV